MYMAEPQKTRVMPEEEVQQFFERTFQGLIRWGNEMIAAGYPAELVTSSLLNAVMSMVTQNVVISLTENLPEDLEHMRANQSNIISLLESLRDATTPQEATAHAAFHDFTPSKQRPIT